MVSPPTPRGQPPGTYLLKDPCCELLKQSLRFNLPANHQNKQGQHSDKRQRKSAQKSEKKKAKKVKKNGAGGKKGATRVIKLG